MAPIATPTGALTPLVNAWSAPDGALVQVGTRLVFLSAAGNLKQIATLPPEYAEVDVVWPDKESFPTIVAIIKSPAELSRGNPSPAVPTRLALHTLTPDGPSLAACMLA